MAKDSKYIQVPKWCAILSAIVFVGGIVATGLCVYYLAPPRPTEELTTDSTGGVTTTTSGPTTAPLSEEYRLPRHVLPETYEVRLLPFIEEGNFTFNGHVTITVTCVEPSNNITLHYNDMVVTLPTQVRSTDGEVLEVIGSSYNTENNHFVILLDSTLTAGKTYTISMDFIGNVNDGLNGFYRASYVDKSGNTKWFAVTQFEAIGARRAFPCFDEPNMKAKFTLTLGRKTSMNTHANVKIAQEGVPVEGVPGMVWDIYEQTPERMSTYLIAFLVSDFQKFEGRRTSSGAETGVIGNPTFTAEEADMALTASPSIVEFYEEYTGIQYAFPKVDQVGVTRFSFGAMENWGLVIYRDEYLFYPGPNIATTSTKKRIIGIIAHELAHQWFGNTVTLDWWSAIFLNEGFATLMEYKGMDAVHPEWQTDDLFLSETLQYVMRGTDSLDSTRPMYFPINDNDIMKYFDDVAYEKSGSVLRMIEDALGAPTFQKGIRNYLQARKFQNAEIQDLTYHLDTAAIEDGVTLPLGGLIPALDTWIYQKNFPLVTVTRDYSTGKASITQQRFVRAPYPKSTEEYYWWVPLTYTQDFVDKSFLWLPNATIPTEISGLDQNKFLIFNLGQKGYYRVNYDEQNWNLIGEALSTNPSAIVHANRAQIIDDVMNLAKYGYVDYPIALSLTKFLANEREWLPWSSFDANAVFLDNMLSGQSAYAHFRVFMLRLVKPLYDDLTFQESESDELLTAFTRILAVKWACKFRLSDCVQNSNTFYDAWIAQEGVNNGTVPPNLRSTVLCTAIQNGDRTDFDNAVEIFKKSTEKSAIATALTCTTDTVMIDRLLGWTITDVDSPIQKGDTSVTDAIYRNLANNPTGRTQAFNFLTSKWEDVKQFYSAEVGATWLKYISAYFSRGSQAEELRAFRDAHTDEPDTAYQLGPAIERADANVEWAATYYQEIADWLASEVATSG